MYTTRSPVGLLLLSAVSCFLLFAATCDAALLELHVSLSGRVNATGNATDPLNSIEAALSLISKLGQVPSGGIKVWLHKGRYARTTTLKMDGSMFPGSSAQNPVVFQAMPNEDVRITGGLSLPATAWRAISSSKDGELYSRLGTVARKHVMVMDLPSQGITDLGNLSYRGQAPGTHPANYPIELYFGGQRMSLARWPNVDESNDVTIDYNTATTLTFTGTTTPDVSGVWTLYGTHDDRNSFIKHIGNLTYYLYRTKVKDNKNNTLTAWYMAQDVEMGYPTAGKPFFYNYNPDLNAKGIQFSPSQGATGTAKFPDNIPTRHKGYTFTGKVAAQTSLTFNYIEDRHATWSSKNEFWFSGLWYFHWADTTLPGTINTADKTVTLGPITKLPYGMKEDQPYFVFNVLEELDSGGEYYVDRASGKLLFWPPSAIDSSESTVAMSRATLLTLSALSGVRFADITFELSRNNLVTVNNCNDTVFKSCTVRNSGYGLISVNGGFRTGFDSCWLQNSGSSGISMSGGNRLQLLDSENYVINSVVTNFSFWDRTYTPAFSISGCGNIIRRNKIRGTPHAGILFGGNEHKIEYNEISDCCKYASDSGTIYGGRDWGMRGNKIQYNFIHDIPGFDSTSYVQGIYVDDAGSGVTVNGNILYNIYGNSMMGSGGRDNIFTNNIIVQANCALQNDRRAATWGLSNVKGDSWNLLEKIENMHYQQDPWKTRYPELAAIPDNFFIVNNSRQYNWSSPQGVIYDCNVGYKNAQWTCFGSNSQAYFKRFANNVITDPLFVDLPNGNIHLRSDSPLPQMSCYKAIDVDSIGATISPTSPAELFDASLASSLLPFLGVTLLLLLSVLLQQQIDRRRFDL